MEEGALLYYLCDKEWLECTLQSKRALDDGGSILAILRSVEGQEFEVRLEAGKDPESVKLRNDAEGSEVANLISLPYLHEPAILFCLERRYHSGDIYTYTGPILIAINPFQRLNIYTPQILASYFDAGLMRSQGIEASELPPHVFAIGAFSRRLKTSLVRYIKYIFKTCI
jgi:myosin heavy subunit